MITEITWEQILRDHEQEKQPTHTQIIHFLVLLTDLFFLNQTIRVVLFRLKSDAQSLLLFN